MGGLVRKELAVLPCPELQEVLRGLSCLREWPSVTYTVDIRVSFKSDPVIYEHKTKLGLSQES